MSFGKVVRWIALLMVGAYRTLGTTFLGGSCRFEPSCSQYAAEAFHAHAPGTAFKLTMRRLWRCRPGGDFGYDPVPCCGGHHAES